MRTSTENEQPFPSPAETRASLILRLQDGSDVVAWEEFVQIYSPVIYRVAAGRGFQNADAENVVQEVLLAVARSITAWLDRSDRGSFRAWLLRIARNESYDLIHAKATRKLGQDGEQAERLIGDLPANEDLASRLDLEHERVVFQWAAKHVRETVAESTWQAFALTHLDGHSVESTAKKLKFRPGNVYLARSRIMARIKELVSQYEANE